MKFSLSSSALNSYCSFCRIYVHILILGYIFLIFNKKNVGDGIDVFTNINCDF